MPDHRRRREYFRIVNKSEVILNLGLIAPNGRLPPSLHAADSASSLSTLSIQFTTFCPRFSDRNWRCQAREIPSNHPRNNAKSQKQPTKHHKTKQIPKFNFSHRQMVQPLAPFTIDFKATRKGLILLWPACARVSECRNSA
jgi:hypothetical protein